MSTGAPEAPSGGDRPLRVLVLDHTASLGGAELALERLCKVLDRKVVDPRVLLFEDGPLQQRIRRTGIPVGTEPVPPALGQLDRVSTGRFSRWPRTAVQAARFTVRLTRRVRRLRPDLIYTTSLKSDLIGIVVAMLTRRPLVWHVHDRISPDYLPVVMVRLVRLLSRVPAAVIVNSRATARTLPGVPVVLAYPGFEEAQVLAAPHRRSDGRVVGMIGRISPTKGQAEFVAAGRLVLEEYPDVQLRIVGAPMFGAQHYAEQVRRHAEDLGDRIAWLDFTDDVGPQLDALDAFVHASPVPEPFGQVVVEAMIRGVPVVATRAGGVPEILRDDGQTLGVLVEPGDVADLARGISEVLADPDAAARRAEQAWASARERFSVDRTAATVTATWRRAAANVR
ncbi:glycosyltransferase family 4 protein [Pseudactinotalea sp. Z1732]|uniref:glycosyltransferase family 4 protein n=1 Tax=Micrococcales TaxID=85006 RepID=UPI003C7B30B1